MGYCSPKLRAGCEASSHFPKSGSMSGEWLPFCLMVKNSQIYSSYCLQAKREFSTANRDACGGLLEIENKEAN